MDGFYDVFDFWEKMVNGGNEYRPFSSNSLPPYDEYLDEEGNFCVDMALAGYTEQDLDIDVNDTGLLLKIETPKKAKVMKKRIHQGIKNSKMDIKIFIPVSRYNVSKTVASFKEGILSLKAPIRDENKFQRIEIRKD